MQKKFFSCRLEHKHLWICHTSFYPSCNMYILLIVINCVCDFLLSSILWCQLHLDHIPEYSSAVILFIMILALIYKLINLFLLIIFWLFNVSDFHFLFCTVCFIRELFRLPTFKPCHIHARNVLTTE